jgi:deoxyribonuclease-4
MQKMKELIFGSPGIPRTTEPYNTANGVARCRELGLDAMELEFTHSVNINEKKAPEVAEARKKANLVFTCHGSYYINLAALEAEKRKASEGRVLQAVERLHSLDGWSLTWHAGYFLKREPEVVYPVIKKAFQDIRKKMIDKGWDTIWIRPETTGKPTQWGDIDETIKLSQDVEGVLPCVDFAHIYARDGKGTYNTTEKFKELLNKLEKGLGRTGLNNMHIHMSGIEYGPKGEKKHLFLKDSKFNWKDLMQVWKEYKIKGVVINESPNVEDDALLMQKYWKKL